MDNLRQLFAECDLDRSGSLGRGEFKELCKRIGLDMGAAEETFERLDIDKNNQITFDEFVAGFQQYRQQSDSPATPKQLAGSREPSQSPALSLSPSPSSTPSPSQSPAHPDQQRLRPASGRVRARASPAATTAGTLSLGGAGGGGGGGAGKMCTAAARTRGGQQSACSSSSAGSFNGSSSTTQSSSSAGLGATGTSGQESSVEFGACSGSLGDLGSGPPPPEDIVVYSSDLISDQSQYRDDQGSGSGQFGSLLSTASSTGYSQMKTMQDLLDCVQKLQNENQILTQIFFKDKREREEYISQLGEEFDQQLKEVEERANRRAKEELESEKKRLREMMQAERETLQHHYQTLERISKLVKVPNGSGPDRLEGAGGEGGKAETFERVKSQLEDTFVENRQLKRSLLDTKTDVALIWKEMEKLKKQYEEKLSSAYEKHKETQSECDHIKQQLNLMKDSNRKLQDASDVITHYITDKVEPVIKVASGCNLNDRDENQLEHSQHLHLNGALRGANSAANSRRGSILSEYLNGSEQTVDEGQSELIGLERTGKKDARVEGRQKNETAQFSLRVPSGTTARNVAGLKASKSEAKLDKLSADAEGLKLEAKESSGDGGGSISSKERVDLGNGARKGTSTLSPIKNFGKNLLLGARAQSDAKAKDPNDEKGLASKLAETKSVSADQVDEPIVQPADGPSKATFNIILVGDSFVGKSSFAARFIEGSFVQGLISNCSIDFKTKAYKVDGQNYTVNLWDTA